MELDELKDIWKKQDNNLESKLSININELKTIEKMKANSNISSLIKYEIFSIILGVFFIMIISYFLFLRNLEFQYFISGALTLMIFFIFLSFCFIRLKGFYKLKKSEKSILETQKEIATQKLRMYKQRKIEIALFPVIYIVFFPFYHKLEKNADIFDDPLRYIIIVIVTSIAAIYLSKWFYRVFYDTRIQKYEETLASIAEFEKEN